MSNAKSEKLVPGSSILISVRDRPPETVVLGKVGRRWATIQTPAYLGWNNKIDITDVVVRNYHDIVIGKWYRSEEDYQEAIRLEKLKKDTDNAWRAFRMKVGDLTRIRPPQGITAERIAEADRLLFGCKDEEKTI
jgi:hypothetical protein